MSLIGFVREGARKVRFWFELYLPQTLSVLGGSYPNILLMEDALPSSVLITRTLCLCFDLGELDL